MQKFLFILTLLIFSGSRSQELLWEKTIGGDNTEWIHHAFQNSKGNYVFSGYTHSSVSGEIITHSEGMSDSWILETDTEGNILWQQTFGGSSYDMINKILELEDGTYLLAGHSYSWISGDKTEDLRGHRDLWIIKLNQNRDIEWQRTYGGNDADDLDDIVRTNDGGFLLTSTSISSVWGDKTTAALGKADIWILKLDHRGNLEWQKSYGGEGYDSGAQIEKKDNGNFVIAASSSSGISETKSEGSRGNADYWIFEMDPLGRIIWQRTIGGNNGDHFKDLQATPDGGFLLAGDSSSNVSGEKTVGLYDLVDLWFVKITAQGDILWQRTYGGNSTDWLSNLYPSQNSGYMVGAMSHSDAGFDKTEESRGDRDFWMFNISEDGEKCWDKTLGGNSADQPMYGFEDSDGNYVLAGWTDSGTSGDKKGASRGGRDGWIVKIKPEIIPPVVNTPEPYLACDNDGDGFAEFDLSKLQEDIIGNQSRLELSYFDNIGNPLPSPLPANFTNTIKGEQLITVLITRTDYTCSSVSIEIKLSLDDDCEEDKGGNGNGPDLSLYFPNFFSPNDDGYNDQWGALDGTGINLKSIHIFDRYGKLIKELSAEEKWNGEWNGKVMPVDDYWFSALTSKNEVLRGHFSLLR